MSNYTVESTKVETSDGAKLHTRLFKPIEEGDVKDNLVIVLVHPFSILGGCQALLKGIAAGLAEKGYKAVTFDMRGAGKSTGRATLTGFAEIKDVIAVCKWVCGNLSSDRILLVGSSAGCSVAALKSLLHIWCTNCRHHKAVLNSPKPKLFVMGTRDGFTSVKQLQNKLSSAVGRVETHLIEGASHFQMEGPEFDNQMDLANGLHVLCHQNQLTIQ
ncbi:hypothetical protein D5086_000131 [Populus alba]|uniref:Uncharacterized protein n=1 Tax=Populus alba TaxID=43335 RepID=A0ACC4CX60_POPAL